MSFDPNDAKSLFLQAAELSAPAERAAFLERACSGNAELQARVEALLDSHNDPGSFLNQPAVKMGDAPAATDMNQASGAASGTRFSREETEGLTPPRSPGNLISRTPKPESSVSLDFLAPCDTPGRLGKLGPYEILEVIGRGGMGIVLRAMDPKLNRVVAIKVLVPN